MSYTSNIIEAPIVTIDNFYHEEKTLIVHNCISQGGKLFLNKIQAVLLMAELKKFIESK